MKKCLIYSAVMSLVVVLISVIAFTSAPRYNFVEESAVKDSKVITVTDSKASAYGDELLKSRFLNMLNRNYVYDDAYYTVEDIVNDSVIALLDMRDDADDSFINQAIVSGFIYDMYGIEADYSEINADFPKKEGYVYILPRGYELYSHEIVSIVENEDGTYTVKTNLVISSHGGTVSADVCETLFVKNENSQFGYNIVYSNIGASASAA